MAPTEMVPDQRPPSNASVQRSRAHRSPSSDSMSSVASQPLSPSSSHPSLRKRHSTYMRVTERSTSPIPELPPQRPPRNPARASTAYPVPKPYKSTSPSPSSRSTREDITPWDFQSVPLPEERFRLVSAVPSLKSKASSIGATTGPVEDVTPWELFPAPVTSGPQRPPSLSNVVLAQIPAAPSPTTLYPTKLTGLVEDVTPWELQAEPEQKAQPLEFLMSSIPAPSRSKPPSIVSNSSLQGCRPSTTTGPTEEVTPWELQLSPTAEVHIEPDMVPHKSSQQRKSMSLSKALLEEIMPWELYPAPPVPAVNGGNNTKHSTSNSRSNTASSKILADIGLRQRRSTGSRASKTTRSHSNSSKTQSRINSSQAISNSNPHDVQPTSRIPQPSPVSTPVLSNKDITPAPAPSVVSSKASSTTKKKPQFSTADRTILEELKRNIQARAAQFKPKGVGVHLTDGSVSLGKRHHPFSKEEAPYPRSYDREVMDLDVWDTLNCHELCKSVTWHQFKTPPRKVLDIGCGTGTWVLTCAQKWPDTEFVGLDIVPLQPDLSQVGSNDWASRIRWVQTNFLEGLPFSNEEFDFVYIKRIALGVPEDRWDALFDEIWRVMKPGGSLEMVEEDLYFPGKPQERDSQTPLPSPLSRSSSMASVGDRRSSISSPSHRDNISTVDEHLTSTTPTLSKSGFAPRPSSPETVNRVSFSHDDTAELKSQAGSTTPPGSPPNYVALVAPHSRSSARPTLYVRTNHNSGFSFPTTSPPKSNNSSLFSGSAVSLFNLTQHSDDNHLFRRRRSSTNISSLADPPILTPSSVLAAHQESRRSMDGHMNAPRPSSLKPEAVHTLPFLLRTPAKPPANPRDHSLLEYIYNETMSSRFINTSPISLLATYLEYHFTDAHHFPPLNYTFPPTPVKPEVEFDSDSEEEEDDEPHHSGKEAGLKRRYTSSRPSDSSSQRHVFSNEKGEILEEHRYVSSKGVLDASSPYVILDENRSFAPAPRSGSSGLRQKDVAPTKQKEMITKQFTIDLRALNLHLALRVKEILACSESMWEWVTEAQKSWLNEKEAQRKNGRQSIEVYRQASLGDSPRDTVLEMGRDDFNQLLLNFEMDMQDQASLNTALAQRFHWHVIDSPPPQGRKIFNTACEKYEKWVRREHRSSISSSIIRPSRSSLHAPTNINVSAPTPDTPMPSGAVGSKSRARSNSHTILLNGNDHHNDYGLSLLTPQKSDASVHFALPAVAPTSLPPTQKLSRTVTVFIASKPEDASPKS